MPIFSSHRAFAEFEKEIRTKWRFGSSPNCQRFLADMLRASESRVRVVKAGSRLFRARIGSEWVEQTDDYGKIISVDNLPFTRNDMVPAPEHALDGRVSPAGVPVLYLATDYETALSETRPWVGADVSVATFEVLRDKRIANCEQTGDAGLLWWNDEPPEGKWDDIVWRSIGSALSRPRDPGASHARLAATQLVAEAFRSHDFDGISYKSHLGNGYNVALFDPAAARWDRSQLYSIDGVSYRHSVASNVVWDGRPSVLAAPTAPGLPDEPAPAPPHGDS